jgi:O-antigen/teichoic acid export membrane protein
MVSAAISRARSKLYESPLLESAYSLMLNTVVTSLVGAGFWVVAARLYSTTEVGRDSALIATMITLSSICQLNMHNGLIRFLPGAAARTGRVALGAYALSGLAAVLITAGFVVVMPHLSKQFEFMADDWPLALLYVAATLLWGVFTLQDSALTALRQAKWVPVENLVFGLLKLGALPLLLILGVEHGVFTAWFIPMALLLVPMNWFIFRRAIPRHTERAPAPGSTETEPSQSRNRLVTFMAQDYLASVLIQISLTLLPIVVVALLGSRANAYFYMPFMIVYSFDSLFLNVTASLTVEGALDQVRIGELTRKTIRHFGGLLVVGVVILVVAAPLLLLPFGGDYASNGASVLRLLAVGSLFRATLFVYSAVCRLQGRGGRILVAEGAMCVLLMGLIFLLGKQLGLTGIALSWMASAAIVAIAVAPRLVRTLRSLGHDRLPQQDAASAT